MLSFHQLEAPQLERRPQFWSQKRILIRIFWPSPWSEAKSLLLYLAILRYIEYLMEMEKTFNGVLDEWNGIFIPFCRHWLWVLTERGVWLLWYHGLPYILTWSRWALFWKMPAGLHTVLVSLFRNRQGQVKKYNTSFRWGEWKRGMD